MRVQTSGPDEPPFRLDQCESTAPALISAVPASVDNPESGPSLISLTAAMFMNDWHARPTGSSQPWKS
jgi:hypothetical protein